MDYKTKLKNPKWQKKRLEIFNRDNFKCQSCGLDDFELHIHHLKYEAKEPWLESSNNLVTVCCFCHEFIEILKQDGYDTFPSKALNRPSNVNDGRLMVFVASGYVFIRTSHWASYFAVRPKTIQDINELLNG